MRVAIAGLGLVGGSIARGLAAAGHHVTGVDDPAVLRRARRAGAIAAAAASAAEAAVGSDVVFLAAPPRANLRLLRTLAGGAHGAIVTDVGSVKRPICAEAVRLGFRRFVGGHPMAGSAATGFGASDATLFEGRAWVLTPAAGRRPPRMLLALIRDLGARPVVVTTPADHDRAVAFLSHVPQVLAWALADAARADAVARRHLRLAGPAYRDMTRIAGSPPRLWAQILDQNRDEVYRALAALRRALARRSPR
jgi:prephenate dehydrogenase